MLVRGGSMGQCKIFSLTVPTYRIPLFISPSFDLAKKVDLAHLVHCILSALEQKSTSTRHKMKSVRYGLYKSSQLISLQYSHGASCVMVQYPHGASCVMVQYPHGASCVIVLYSYCASCVMVLYRHIITTKKVKSSNIN